jgi:lactate racemase
MNTCIETKTGSWSGERTLRLSFPENWTVKHIKGASLTSAGSNEIRSALDNPVSGEPLSRLLQNKRSVAIVVDDPTRPTPVFDILGYILHEARLAGIPERNVTIIVALGTHVLKDTSLIRAKLKSILDTEIRLVLPNCCNFRDYVFMGRSKLNIPVFAHRDYATADVKIAISGIYPHGQAGFSGGAKILIGVLHLSTLSLFHQKMPSFGAGNIETPFRHELESFADLVGVDYSVNVVLNHEKQVHRLWCGDFKSSFREAADYAKERFRVQAEPDGDVVISNAYPLDTSLSVMGKSFWPFKHADKTAKCILMASPSNLADYRLRFCASNGEAYREAIRAFLPVRLLRRVVRHARLTKTGLEFKRNPGLMWERDFVLFMPRHQMPATGKPSFFSHRGVFVSWESLVAELRGSFPDNHDVKVSFYDFAPLYYVCPDKGRSINAPPGDRNGQRLDWKNQGEAVNARIMVGRGARAGDT